MYNFIQAVEGCALCMQTEKTKITITWLLTFICMAVIFWLSSRTATESSQQSSLVLKWLIEIFGDNIFTDFIVRKLAHCLEFTGLSFLFNLSLYQTKKKLMILPSVLLTSAYAVTDEFHQLFVEGRSCQITDWAIDTAGAILGAIGFLAIYSIVKHINKSVQNGKNCIDSTNK